MYTYSVCLVALVLALGALMAPASAAPKPANVSAILSFADAVGPAPSRIRSDGSEPYANSVDCVQSWYALPKGNFFLRTVSSQSPCGIGVSVRTVLIDLSQRQGGCLGPIWVYDQYQNRLDACGENVVQDVRMVSDRLFSGSATALDVPFSLQPDFQNTAFSLEFVETLAVEGSGDTRTMTASGDAAADLWQISRRTKTLVGRYLVPMSATVAKQP